MEQLVQNKPSLSVRGEQSCWCLASLTMSDRNVWAVLPMPSDDMHLGIQGSLLMKMKAGEVSVELCACHASDKT